MRLCYNWLDPKVDFLMMSREPVCVQSLCIIIGEGAGTWGPGGKDLFTGYINLVHLYTSTCLSVCLYGQM